MPSPEVRRKQSLLKRLCKNWVRENYPDQFAAFRQQAGMKRAVSGDFFEAPVKRKVKRLVKRKYTRRTHTPSYTEIMDKLHA